MLLEYVLGYGTDVKDEPGFRERYKRLKEDAIFKVYDLFNEQISKRFFRTVFWVFALLFSFISIFFKCLKGNATSPIQITLLYFGLLQIASSLIFTFFGLPMPRYSFATEFIFYLITNIKKLNFDILKFILYLLCILYTFTSLHLTFHKLDN
jgi:hypothetical protein